MQARKIVTLCGLVVVIFAAGCATTPSKVAYIVSEGQGATSVLVQNADGSRPVRVPGLSGAMSEIVMSPGGQRLAYVTGETTTGLDQIFVVDLDENNNIIGVRRNVSDELSSAGSFSPKFLDDDRLLYLSETRGDRILVLVDLRTGGKQKISAISGSIDTVIRYNIDGKEALFFGLNKEIRRYDLPTGPLRSIVANTGSASGLAYEKMGVFENALIFSTMVTPKERAFSHMRLDGTELRAVAEIPSEFILPIIRLAYDPAARVHRFSLFDFTLVTRLEEELVTLEGYEITAQKITERHLFWVVRDLRNPDLVRAVYAAKGLEGLSGRAPTREPSISRRPGICWSGMILPARKIWGAPLDRIGSDPVDLSAGVARVANRPFSVSAHNIGVVTEDGRLYLLSTNRTSPPRLLGQGIHMTLTRP
ncbi:MAG: hypothetical protein M5R38_18830 [Candidatus Methylomirabilis sp.]|nr:hypothetical protein [Candidatus Methylomirabilis sp.]